MRFDRTDVDTRQIFVSDVNPQLVHADLRQLGGEFSLYGRKKLNIDGAKRGLIRKWVGEADHSTPRHFRTPGFAENKKTPGPPPGPPSTHYLAESGITLQVCRVAPSEIGRSHRRQRRRQPA
jgi:hypothetical protein